MRYPPYLEDLLRGQRRIAERGNRPAHALVQGRVHIEGKLPHASRARAASKAKAIRQLHSSAKVEPGAKI